MGTEKFYLLSVLVLELESYPLKSIGKEIQDSEDKSALSTMSGGHIQGNKGLLHSYLYWYKPHGDCFDLKVRWTRAVLWNVQSWDIGTAASFDGFKRRFEQFMWVSDTAGKGTTGESYCLHVAGVNFLEVSGWLNAGLGRPWVWALGDPYVHQVWKLLS